jgi:superfamily I DNA/RNA helicase
VWRRLRFVIDQAREWGEATDGNLREYLQWVARQSSEGSRVAEAVLPESDDDAVRIMTIHAAKGLEYDTVFCVGWEEGLFPSQRALDEGGVKSLEEERRLAYVAITRARRLAVILHAANRRIYGQWNSSIPSRASISAIAALTFMIARGPTDPAAARR